MNNVTIFERDESTERRIDHIIPTELFYDTRDAIINGHHMLECVEMSVIESQIYHATVHFVLDAHAKIA